MRRAGNSRRFKLAGPIYCVQDFAVGGEAIGAIDGESISTVHVNFAKAKAHFIFGGYHPALLVLMPEALWLRNLQISLL